MAKYKTINCPTCGGKGHLGKQKSTTKYPDGSIRIIEVTKLCTNPNCDNGVVTIKVNNE